MRRLDSIMNKTKEFTTMEEALKFARKHFKDFGDQLKENEKILIMSIQNHGLRRGITYDDECILAIKKNWIHCPKVPFDIVVYRSGKMKYSDRPYLSASFLKRIARDRFSKFKGLNTHKIIIKKGAKIIPLCALNPGYGDPEAELIIDARRLKRKFRYYQYE